VDLQKPAVCFVHSVFRFEYLPIQKPTGPETADSKTRRKMGQDGDVFRAGDAGTRKSAGWISEWASEFPPSRRVYFGELLNLNILVAIYRR
jgi:hypothetical protein